MNALLGILGTTALLIDDEVTDTWGKPRERAVLATLAVHVNRVVQIGTLIRWAWPADTPIPRNPVETFHTYAARIRKALRRLPTPAHLRAGQGGYRLEMDRSLIDHHRFRELVMRGRMHIATHEPEPAIELIDEALTLFRGTPLADLSSPAAEAWRTGVVQNELLTANTTVIELLVAARRFDEALVRLDDLYSDYPDDVTLATLRLTALYGERRGTHATAFYFAARQRFKNNGDDHAAEHLRLHNDMLRAKHANAHHPTPTSAPRQLPPVHRCFVGRGELLEQLDNATSEIPAGTPSGVVLVDGPGGVGKTALVVRWAHRNRDRFPGGDLFVNMHGYANRAMVGHIAVVDEFLTALGQAPESPLPPRGREQLLRSLLTGRRTLVILDNVRDTEHVRDLLPLLSNCLVIITSRQWLTTLRTETGARRITVPPLTANESAELLSAQFGPHELAQKLRADLTRLCGGLPLLLTVLAGNLARKSAAGIEEYAARLDRRQLVVGLGDHGDGPTSGAACFNPSYQALTPNERRLFRLLTLHPGPEFSVDAACACTGQSEDDTTRGLARLIGAHLLEEVDAVDRYRFHDVLREYAAYCRDRDEPPVEQVTAQRRVLDYYLGSATHAYSVFHRSYNPPPPLTPLAGVRMATFGGSADGQLWFNRERTNLISAITVAAEHGYHDHAWRLADPVATFLDRAGCNIEARAVRMVALRSTRAIGNQEAEASTLSGLGMNQMKLGDYREARRSLEAALRLVTENGPARGSASILHQLGRVALRQGHTAEALDLFARGMAIDRRSGNKEGMCWAHCRTGQALRATDQFAQALPHLLEATRLAHEIGETAAEATSLREIGAIHHAVGDLVAAVDHCERALAIAENMRNLPVVAEICTVLCEINSSRHQSRLAISFGRRAVEMCERTRDLAQHAHALEVLGNAQHACGDLVDAVVSWRQAAELYEHTGDAASVGRLRVKIDGVPVFYQEIVPIARRPEEAAAPPAWLLEEERTRPIVGDGR